MQGSIILFRALSKVFVWLLSQSSEWKNLWYHWRKTNKCQHISLTYWFVYINTPKWATEYSVDTEERVKNWESWGVGDKSDWRIELPSVVGIELAGPGGRVAGCQVRWENENICFQFTTKTDEGQSKEKSLKFLQREYSFFCSFCINSDWTQINLQSWGQES